MGKLSLVLPVVFLMLAGHKIVVIYICEKRIQTFVPILIYTYVL